jgi:hypothetical protein
VRRRALQRFIGRPTNASDRGQERGELATNRDGDSSVRTPDTGTYADLGIDRRRVAEWREIRDAGEAVVEAAFKRALDEGRAPTKALVLEAAKTIRAENADERRADRTEMLKSSSRPSLCPVP